MMAKSLGVSQTAISKALPKLTDEDLIKVAKDKESKRLSIELNRDNKRVIQLKRVNNLEALYDSGLVDFLQENFPGDAIILFGSYSYGEDTIDSDIDIAIIGSKGKKIDLTEFNKILKKEIIVNFYKDFNSINKNLKENIFNGILLSGGIRLWKNLKSLLIKE